MSFSECPYFQRWISRSVARMDIDDAGKEALTYGATRIERLSSTVVFLPNPLLALSAERVTTNLMARLRKGP